MEICPVDGKLVEGIQLDFHEVQGSYPVLPGRKCGGWRRGSRRCIACRVQQQRSRYRRRLRMRCTICPGLEVVLAPRSLCERMSAYVRSSLSGSGLEHTVTSRYRAKCSCGSLESETPMQLEMQNWTRKSHSERIRSIGHIIERKLRFCLFPIGENLDPEYSHGVSV